eukprot:GFUD01028520.1.p1 GENE.GFUD01028520.1~~GFUD01028520.1.p1  ORF type:complete len:657 (-),score=159.95 GFUD01028520.1:22-1992(-)
MDVDGEDLHGLVLNAAFKAMISNPTKVLVNTEDNMELSLNRNILILFSPVLRDILSTVPCCTIPTMYLPDISTKTIIRLRDILNKGISSDFWDLKESGEVLEAASALGIDMQRLHYGEEVLSSSSGEVLVNVDNIGNKSKHTRRTFDEKKFEGKQIVLVRNVKNPISSKSVEPRNTDASNISTEEITNPNVATAATDKVQSVEDNVRISKKSPSKSSGVYTALSKAVNDVQVKEEVAATDEFNGSEEPMEQVGPTNPVVPVSLPELGMTADTEDLKNQCEKCKKAFASLLLLRYHYCFHFRGILKKQFANMFHDNKCLECYKIFANPGRLLLHIGVQHDKINDILKSKGITELPPFSATAAALGGDEASVNTGNIHQPSPVVASDDDTTEKVSKSQEIASLRDIKNIPLISTQPEPSNLPAVENVSTPCNTSITPKNVSTPCNTSITPRPSNASLNESSSAVTSNASSVTPPANISDLNIFDSTTECNYELECQVCDQKLKTISLLEQHCCRHFMKELQDQYSSLMDGLKCNICYNSFKQKHSLLLHIGCKHGKINDILRQKKFAALPCPVTNTSSAAMQKQLVQIKKERMDVKADKFSDMRSEMMEDETPSEASTALLNETPPGPASEESTPGFSTTLDEILKKYKFKTGSSEDN